MVEDRPGFFRTLPPWMGDPTYCERLDSGLPPVALAALETLALTLELMRYAEVAPSSGTVIPEEDMHVPIEPQPTCSRINSACHWTIPATALRRHHQHRHFWRRWPSFN